MLRKGVGFMIAALAGAFAATLSFAGDLREGEWSGTLTLPDEEDAEQVSYEVNRTEYGQQEISLIYKDGSFPFTNIQLLENQLQFEWTPGDEPIKCVLELNGQDGSYEGDCPVSDNESPFVLKMVPPKEE